MGRLIERVTREVLGPRRRDSQTICETHYRPQQYRLAKEVASFLASKSQMMIAESPAGSGKSLAYSVPFGVAASPEQKLIISTHTRALQYQLLQDWNSKIASLPALEKTVVAAFGRSNYLCVSSLDKLHLLQHGANIPADELLVWYRSQSTSSSYPSHGPENLSAAIDTCAGSQCEYYRDCEFYTKRSRCEDASVIIVNHALYLRHLWMLATAPNAEGLLPKHHFLVVDEAHHLVDAATSAFTINLTTSAIDRFCLDHLHLLRKSLSSPVFLSCKSALAALSHSLKVHPEFQKYSSQDGALPGLIAGELSHAALALKSVLTETTDRTRSAATPRSGEPEAMAAGTRLLSRLELTAVGSVSGMEWRYDLRHDGSLDSRGMTLTRTPSSIDQTLAQVVWRSSMSRKTLLISSTLASQGSFDDFKKRVGVSSGLASREYIGPEVYDYARNALLYVPTESYSWQETEPYFHQLAEQVHELLDASGGGALLLFTSHRAMNEIYRRVNAGNSDLPMAVQGEDTPTNLLKWFSGAANAVLFGTYTFWEGIDLPGKQLRMVVIDKLPFPPPRSGGQNFETSANNDTGGFEEQFDTVEIRLRQGVGRLLRGPNDFGTVAILDSRLFRRSYGPRLLAALPPMKITRDIGDVHQFFRNKLYSPENRSTCMLEVGQNLPEFSTTAYSRAGDENTITQDSLHGKIAVVYFYPKDDTPGCTTQACGFTSLDSDFAAAGAVIVGVSPDTTISHRKFAEKYSLPFTLISDPEHSLASAFGVWVEKKNYGKTYMGIERTTFVFAKDGKLAKVFPKVRVDGHHDKVLDFVKQLDAS